MGKLLNLILNRRGMIRQDVPSEYQEDFLTPSISHQSSRGTDEVIVELRSGCGVLAASSNRLASNLEAL